MKIAFSPPDITQAEIDGVTDALRSGWITTGPKTKEFERRIAAACGTARAVCLNSATAGLELALRILGVGPGDEVITSAYTYTASASVIDHVGAKIILCDIGKTGFEPDYDALSSLITEKTKAIIPVDIGGRMCDYDRLYAIVDEKRGLFRAKTPLQARYGRVAVLADAAHSFGSERHGVKSGAAADLSVFSFHAVKNLTTAEGGAVTWRSLGASDDDALYRLLQLWSLHGQDKDALAKTRLGSWEYDITMTGYKCNMTDIMAAIGLAQLDRYPTLLARRRALVARYDAAVGSLASTLVHIDADNKSDCHLYLTNAFALHTVEARNAVIARMAEKGIACNVHYKPLPMMTAYRALGFDIADYPNALARYTTEITLPLHTLLTDDEAEYVISNFVGELKAL